MGLKKLKNTGQITRFNRAIIFILAFIFSYSILVTSVATRKYSLKEGDIAKTDIKAPREIIDRKATDIKIAQAEKSVSEQYEKKAEVKDNVLNDIKILFSKAIYLKDSTAEDKIKVNILKNETSIELSEEGYISFLKLTKDDLTLLEDSLINIMSDIYDNMTITNGRSEDIIKARDAIAERFNNSDYSKQIKELGKSIAQNQVKPNFFYDEAKTQELRKNAAKEVENLSIKKDQIIVKEGEPVTANQIEILSQLSLLDNGSSQQWYVYISIGVLVFVIMLLQWYYLFKYYKDVFQNNSKLTLISILNCIALLLARTFGLISPFFIPLACVPMLLTLLINYKISVALSILNCILISTLVGFNVEVTIVGFLSAVLGAMVLRKMQARNDILYSSLYISIINTVITFSIGILLSDNIIEVLKKAGSSGLSGLIAAVLTIGILPVFESTFDIVTSIKLLELLNPNHPLLKKLLIEAPGTYHHSIMVANLAEVATEAVGGNAILARVGAYYHDVGKIKRPYFFKENQLGNDNPHDKITPSLSSLIITSHVKDGLELAKAYKIPTVIQDIIEQHHGNSLVKYFYLLVKNASENLEDINEKDFRYQGPNPKSKESGVIMLADSVEASVRSISEPTAEKIEIMVNKIIKDRLDDGQLDDCDLTLRDVQKIRIEFLKSLTGIYHQRIEYPIDKTMDNVNLNKK